MIVDFQENASLMKKTGGPWLADKWNANKPPQFRFFFLYSSPFSSSPAVYDLTDCSQPGDEDYNPVTTAWNIRESLDAKNPNVQSNDFWHITLDGTSKLPVWQVMPTPANVHIFTTAGSGPGNPGPLLNLFWSHIFSGLPIDQNNPETMLFMQWLDFPGFNDGIQGFPLLKQYAKPVLKPVIDCFSGTIEHDASGVKVVLKWATHNAANCTVSGDSSLQSPQTGDNPYKRIISLEEPLNTSYTLTAFSADGNRSTTQTLQVKWKPNPELGPTKWPNGIKLALFSGGAHLVVLQSDLNMEPQSPSTLSFVHPLNLEASLPPFSFPKTVQIYNITVSPIDQDTVFACGTDFPLQMFAFSYNKSTGQAVKSDALPFPPWNTALHVSSDGATLMALLIGAGGHGIGVLNSATLKSMSGSPILTAQEPMVSFGVGPQTGRIFVNYEDKMHVFDPKTYQDVPGSPFRSYSDILLFPSDEQAVFSRVLDLAKLNPTTFAIENKAEFYLNEPISYMITPDNSLLFVSGMNDTKQVINVYDAATMLLQNWSPWEAPDKQIQDMKISPDGTRIFILTGDGDLYAADPYF